MRMSAVGVGVPPTVDAPAPGGTPGTSPGGGCGRPVSGVGVVLTPVDSAGVGLPPAGRGRTRVAVAATRIVGVGISGVPPGSGKLTAVWTGGAGRAGALDDADVDAGAAGGAAAGAAATGAAATGADAGAGPAAAPTRMDIPCRLISGSQTDQPPEVCWHQFQPSACTGPATTVIWAPGTSTPTIGASRLGPARTFKGSSPLTIASTLAS